MKFDLKNIPRIFAVGKDLLIKIKDYGRIFMEPNEQITLCVNEAQDLDIVSGNGGFTLPHQLIIDSSNKALRLLWSKTNKIVIM